MSKITDVEILSKKIYEKHMKKDYLYETFHENTKLNRFKEKILGRNIGEVLSDKNFVGTIRYSEKRYVSNNIIYLPKDYTDHVNSKSTFDELLYNRRSTREFSDEKMSIHELAYILNSSYGISGAIENIGIDFYQELRTSPSAGGLYPLEIYVYTNNVEGIVRGLYHYSVSENALEELALENINLENLTSYSDVAKQTGVILFITGVFPRLSHKYGERAYRFLHLDAGHLGQNLYLSTENIGLGAVAIGGFFDDEINRFLRVDGVTEGVVYEFFIGHKR